MTKTNGGSRIVYITEKLVHQHAQHTTYGLLPAASLFIFTGWFHIHLFYSSKPNVQPGVASLAVLMEIYKLEL